jgi:nicotinamide-nucleotide adenylyltransferase
MRFIRAALIGRFQPFHNGHLHAVKHILEEFEEVVVVIAAAQFNYTIENPFTAGERVEMIKRGLGDLYKRAYVVPVDNVPNNYLWPRHVLSYIPRVEVIFSNNEFVRELFSVYGIKVRTTPTLKGVSGTLVRKLMVEGGDWMSLVPRPVADFIIEINGVERVRRLWRLNIKSPGERY